MINFVSLVTDIGCVLDLSKDEFKDVVIDTIKFAVEEKEYDIVDLDYVFILQDITNCLDNKFDDISIDVINLINTELLNYKILN